MPPAFVRMLGLALALWGAAAVSGGVESRALAEGPTEIAVFPVAASDSSVEGLANVVAQALTAGLQKFPHIHVGARPALDLPGTQLALGCDVASDECLRAATALARTQALLAPSVERTADGDVLVAFLYFDALGTTSRTVSRRSARASGDSHIVDGVRSMLQELFAQSGAPPSSESGAGAGAESASPPADSHDSGATVGLEPTAFIEHREAPILPIAMTAVGGALLGTGAAFGLLANRTQRELATTQVASAAQANRAADKLATGRLQAALCNWGLGLGGALLAAGVTLWILHDPSTRIDSPSANAAAGHNRPALSASIERGGATLRLGARF